MFQRIRFCSFNRSRVSEKTGDNDGRLEPGSESGDLNLVEALRRAQALEKGLRLVVEDDGEGEEIFTALPILTGVPVVFLYPPGREDRGVRAVEAGARHVLCREDPVRQEPLLEALFRREEARGEMDIGAFRQIAHEQEIGLVLTDARAGDLPICYANPAFERISGYPLEDLLGNNCRMLHGAERDQPGLDQIREGLRRGGSVKTHLRNYRKDGEAYWEQVSISPIRGADGGITHYMGLKMDLSQRQDLLEVLRAADERYKLVVEQSQSVLYTLSPEGKLLFVSPSWTWTIGHEISEVIDHPYQDFVDERDHARCGQYLRDLVAGMASDSVEYRIRQKNGPVRWHRSVVRAVYDKEGKVVSLVGNALDITEERQARWELERSETRFRILLEDLPTGVLVAEVNTGEFHYANAEIGRMLGYAPRQLNGRSPADIHPPEELGRVRKMFDEMGRGLIGFANDVPMMRKDGAIFPADIRSVRMELDGQECMIGLFTDISERKENERRTLQARRRVEESEALLKQAQKIAKVGYWILETATNELKWSPEVYEIFGATAKENQSESYESFLSFVHPGDLDEVRRAFDQHLRLREPYELTHRILTGDGKEKHVQERCETEFDADGRPVRSVGVVADITEVKRAQEELQLLFDTMAQGVVYQDGTGRIFRANPAALRLLGLSQDQIEGRTSMDAEWHAIREDGSAFPGEEHPAMVALRTGRPVSNVVMGVYHPEMQAYIWLLVSAEPQFRAGQQRPFQVFASFTDITEQKRMYEELRRQTRLQEMLMNISATYINLPLEKLEGAVQRSLEELGRFVEADRFYVFSYDFAGGTCSNTHEWCAEGIEPMMQALQETSLEGMDDWVETHLRGGLMNVPDVPALPPDSSLRHILEPQGIKSIITMPLMDQGTCIGFIGLDSVRKHHHYSEVEQKLLRVFAEMLVNVRKRLEALNALRENRQFLSQIIENSGSLIYTKDVNGAYLSANRRWCEITGCPLDKALGKTDRELFPEKVSGTFMEQDRTVLASGQACELEEIFEGEHGIRYFLTVKFAIRDHDGRVTGVAGMSTDITERKKAEEDRIAREAAEAENQAKSSFLAKISHEIRTPMNSIIGFAHLLEREQGLSANQLRQIRNISKSGEHLLVMINEILDLSKMEAGRMNVVMQDFNPREMVLDLAGMFEYRAIAKGLAFRVEDVETLPASLRSDPCKIRQILINLIGNAVKFTGSGGVLLRMRIQSRVKEGGRQDSLIFEVEDSGPGIPEEERHRMYDVFYQGHVGLEAGGTGLGLSITKSMVELLDGEIELVSKVGSGSLFRVELPVEIFTDMPVSWHPSRLRVSGVLTDREPYRILVADDQAGNCEYLMDVLQPAGFRVACVRNGLELLELLPEFRPDAVLMNLHMPVLDGPGAIARLRENPPTRDLPVIVISASEVKPDTHPELYPLIQAGLRKPVLPDELFAALGKALGIEYVYEEPASASKLGNTASPACIREEARALPPARLNALREAVETGDMRGFESELAEMERESPRLVTSLRGLASAYNYPDILKILKEEAPA